MNGRFCENIVNGETCGAPPFSWSAEHDNEVRCKKCYDEFVARKNEATDIFKALVQVPSSKLKNAKQTLNDLLGGND